MARILVVEPDRRVRQFIAGILADFGHRVEQCGDANGARRWLRRAQFDVLATDLMLAESDADDLPALAGGAPVLTLSGRRFSPEERRHDRPAGLRDKPFRFADLTRLVGAIVLLAAQNGLHAHSLPAIGMGGN
jgi:DNA-binding response OmpR family regulator